jgi:hypothetical protein
VPGAAGKPGPGRIERRRTGGPRWQPGRPAPLELLTGITRAVRSEICRRSWIVPRVFCAGIVTGTVAAADDHNWRPGTVQPTSVVVTAATVIATSVAKSIPSECRRRWCKRNQKKRDAAEHELSHGRSSRSECWRERGGQSNVPARSQVTKVSFVAVWANKNEIYLKRYSTMPELCIGHDGFPPAGVGCGASARFFANRTTSERG